MTIGEAYNLLNRNARIDYVIKRLCSKRDALQSCLIPGAIQYDSDRVQTSPSDKMPDTVAEIVEIDNKIRRLAQERAETIIKITDMIDLLEDNIEKDVLYERYISQRKISEIAEEMAYTRDAVYKIHRKAVKHLSTIA